MKGDGYEPPLSRRNVEPNPPYDPAKDTELQRISAETKDRLRVANGDPAENVRRDIEGTVRKAGEGSPLGHPANAVAARGPR